MTMRLNLQIGIPTTGRREIVSQVLPSLCRQTRLPDRVMIAVASEADVDRSLLERLPLGFEVVLSEKGSCPQRNRILSRASDADVLLFLDDDFILAPDYLAHLEDLFLTAPDVAVATGTVIADGIMGPGLAFDEGMARIEAAGGRASPVVTEVYNGYGCNMAVRMRLQRETGVTFDEALPLYGWLEDVDFSRRLAARGRIVRSGALVGVHLGVKVSRSPGFSLGYSQIANPVYLLRKRTMSLRHAGVQMCRNVVANIGKLARPEPWIDRRGRVKGNMKALADLVSGRLDTTRILEFGGRR